MQESQQMQDSQKMQDSQRIQDSQRMQDSQEMQDLQQMPFKTVVIVTALPVVVMGSHSKYCDTVTTTTLLQ